MSDTDSLENDLKRFSSCTSTAFDHFQQGKQEGLSDGPLQSGTSSATQTSSAHSSGTRPLIGSTIDIERIYALISPTYSSGPKLKHRILTVPPNGVSNDNNDNEDGNLICRVYDVLKSTGNKSYTILETLGTGKCFPPFPFRLLLCIMVVMVVMMILTESLASPLSLTKHSLDPLLLDLYLISSSI